MADSFTILRKITLLLNFFKWKALGLNVPWSQEFFVKIYKNVRIINPRNIHIEKGVKLFPYCHLKSSPGLIRIGKNSSIGEFTFINSMESVIIGSNVLIAPSCHITDTNHSMKKGELIISQERSSSPVKIGDGAWIGAGVKILTGVTIGNGAVIGAGAVVTKNIPENLIAAGVPAKIIGERSE
jgi:acetyltransferase-like isoleucine patch superfamily enzyme